MDTRNVTVSDIPFGWLKRKKKQVSEDRVVVIKSTVLPRYVRGDICRYCGKQHTSVGAFKRCARNGGE